ncbi:MAG: radical SAM protein [Candidatus Gracilibacteria bacterium]|nr:radical SAM protein [Candidatus Gracilibacteria bacterium]
MKKIYVFDIKNESITRDFKCSSSKANFLKLQTYLSLNGYNFVNNIDEADTFIINTCNHYSPYYQEYMDTINSSNKETIFFGCSKLEEIEVKNNQFLVKAHEPEEVEDIIDPINKKFFDITTFDVDKFYSDSKFTKNRFYIEVSRGCANNCSFCPIKKSIGFVKSKPMESILEEFKNAVNDGFKDINLVSEDCGSYGLDIGLNFGILFNKMCEIKGDYTINLNYISPTQLLKNFKTIEKNAHKISRMILGIQSFSDRILKLMNRPYTVQSVINLIEDIRKVNKHVYIENQIIYCYPTETRKEFFEYLKLAKYYDENIFNLYSNKECIFQFGENDLITEDEINYRTKVLNLMRKKCNYMNLTWENNYFPW